jgi:hypothetical protein
MRATFDRLQVTVADLHPADEADPAKAELVANVRQEMVRLRAGIEEFERGSARATDRLRGWATPAACETGRLPRGAGESRTRPPFDPRVTFQRAVLDRIPASSRWPDSGALEWLCGRRG